MRLSYLLLLLPPPLQSPPPPLQILSADPASCELLAELLLPHLRTYYVEDEHRLPPLLLHKCAQLQHVSARGPARCELCTVCGSPAVVEEPHRSSGR